MPFKSAEQKREYSRLYGLEWRRRPGNMQRVWASNKRTREKVREQLAEYRATLRCSRCPENDPRCLDFHHVGDKETTIAQAIVDGWGWPRILEEIRQCIVLCANCHRKEHARA